jgi:hypothetical protein
MSGGEQRDWLAASGAAHEGNKPLAEPGDEGDQSGLASNAAFGFFLVFGAVAALALIGVLCLVGWLVQVKAG